MTYGVSVHNNWLIINWYFMRQGAGLAALMLLDNKCNNTNISYLFTLLRASFNMFSDHDGCTLNWHLISKTIVMVPTLMTCDQDLICACMSFSRDGDSLGNWKLMFCSDNLCSLVILKNDNVISVYTNLLLFSPVLWDPAITFPPYDIDRVQA